MKFTFPIKTVSEANQREHWTKKNRRKLVQQKEFCVLWRNKTKGLNFKFPLMVTFTRYSCKFMDSDNLAGGFKGVRDQLARELKIDDGSELIKVKYKQERVKNREHYFEVEIVSGIKVSQEP